LAYRLSILKTRDFTRRIAEDMAEYLLVVLTEKRRRSADMRR